MVLLWNIIVCLLDMYLRRGGLDQERRIMEDEVDYLRARIEDIEGGLVSVSNQQGRKRKREDAFFSCVTNCQELVKEARSILGYDVEVCPKKRKVGEQRIWSSKTCAELGNFHSLIKRLLDCEKEAGMLLKDILSSGLGPGRGNLIPVRDLFGQVASVAMEQLKALLLDNEVGRIAINGIKGIGKTFIMKHLHNYVLQWDKRFDHVFWVTSPHEFSIKRVQDAVAAVLKCRLCSDDSVRRRAEILSDKFSGLGSFVMFLDDVPEAHFSLAWIGISGPLKDGKSRLVLTSRSTLVSQMLDCSGTVNVNRLTDEEACQLLLNEARITREIAPLLENVPNSLAKKCDGVPDEIIKIATRMRDIHDPREWNTALVEFS